MSFRRAREQRFPRRGEVYPDDEVDPNRFFGETSPSRKANWKAQQLCKQVERAAAVALAEVCANDSLLGAWVASVDPAPDSGRLLVTVILAPGKGIESTLEAGATLLRSTAAFREEIARSIHRKRVPEIVFGVRLAEEVIRG